jgi:sigma-E factor negative regulatory protein RseC
MIVGTHGQGFKATWLAYLLPGILVVAVLSITYFISDNEELSGILALVIIAPYFLILRTINDRLKKTFSFKIKLINE